MNEGMIDAVMTAGVGVGNGMNWICKVDTIARIDTLQLISLTLSSLPSLTHKHTNRANTLCPITAHA
jgi:hypothetical protein